ncbi:hypothetical protein PGIGA_G00229050 [Pangasianodon gigas]|uniref:Uncharacterized protein n=1 Tax=Pangasianodon gigas TaxID=30993 RepID=A0ACC5WLF9_PANGG|nr:hypothetical protein [Pangasianodon gigas]
MRPPTGPQSSAALLIVLFSVLNTCASRTLNGKRRRAESPERGFGAKERFQIVTQHNRLRSRVEPMAANMQKMVRLL